MKLNILAAAVALVVATAPAMARPVDASSVRYAQSIYCATREAGNPHSRYCDYEAWSQWRARGSWDSQLDNACLRNPAYVPPGCAWR
jgi:hypothetical protein